jgi:hypothetical protein
MAEEERPRISRRKLLTGSGAVAAATVAATAAGWIEVGNPALATTSAGEVGTASGGRNAFEYIGQVDQDGDSLTYYGYLTAVAGLDVGQLFAGSTHDETTARFTFFGTATLSSRAVFNNVFTIDATGSLGCYFDRAGGADFGNPSSFMSGKQITADDAVFHDILSVTAPNTGTPSITAFLQRTAVSKFRLGGAAYKLGHVGLLERSTATGLGTKLDPTPKAVLTVAGATVVTGEA